VYQTLQSAKDGISGQGVMFWKILCQTRHDITIVAELQSLLVQQDFRDIK
jgi:hypothetical protein